VFKDLSLEQVLARLERAQIANAQINSMDQLWHHEQLKARGVWSSVDSSVGQIPALLPPGRIDSFDYRMDPIPEVGEHNESILKELGL